MMGDFGTISALPNGFFLGGRYEIQRVIGQGGMGVVYLALDKQLNDSPRAIKTIKPEQMLDKRGFAQLKQEAQASISLTHQNIVRVINYEEHEGLAYIVMEYISGSTLEEILLEKGRLTVEEFLPIARQICNALDYSHKKKIIHRDIKPSNIFLTEEDEAKLADFGIARVMKDSQTRMTGHMTAGTLIYMPPEVIFGGKPDERADIYSLGITFYEMLAGEPPFVSGDIGLQHRERKPEPIEGIPVELNNAILKALAKAQADRPASAGEYWEILSGELVPWDSKDTPSPPGIAKEMREITNSIGMKLRLIPAGEFMMGAVPGDDDALEDEKPKHRVKITKVFYIGVYPVTQEQYEQVMGENPSGFEGDDCPVEDVSWYEAQEFCDKLSQLTGERYRLPTEAEWEYACRAGTTTKYYWGDEMDGDYAWYEENSGDETHEIGRKQPNAWGLYDMSGNVGEWCGDWYDENYYSRSPAKDPVGPSSGNDRVLRGGRWNSDSGGIRSSTRDGYRPDYDGSNSGFRVVREVE
jgi:formylglycine-generating enzyme required for sulfatase activity/predicted Ser/Thr protein kinase